MIWAQKYIGKKWSKTKDCWYWFSYIQKKEFNRELPLICCCGSSARTITLALKNTKIMQGWAKIKTPIKNGDAVFLSQKSRPHHIGNVVFIDGKIHVIHAVEGAGVVLSSLFSLHCNLWQIMSYWTYES